MGIRLAALSPAGKSIVSPGRAHGSPAGVISGRFSHVSGQPAGPAGPGATTPGRRGDRGRRTVPAGKRLWEDAVMRAEELLTSLAFRVRRACSHPFGNGTGQP